MATSFMIHFACNGKPCYANVYIFGSRPRQYHVHVLNPNVYPGIPDNLILTDSPTGITVLDGDHLDSATLNNIITAVSRKKEEIG